MKRMSNPTEQKTNVSVYTTDWEKLSIRKVKDGDTSLADTFRKVMKEANQ